MDDTLMLGIIIGSLLGSLLIIASAVVLILERSMRRRRELYTEVVTGKVIERHYRSSRYDAHTPGHTTFILTYTVFSTIHTGATSELPDNTEVGTVVKLYVNPNEPEQFYPEGAFLRLKQGITRTSIFVLVLCLLILVLPVIAWLFS